MDSEYDPPQHDHVLAIYRSKVKNLFEVNVKRDLQDLDKGMDLIFSTINLSGPVEPAEGLSLADAVSKLEQSLERVKMLYVKCRTSFNKGAAITLKLTLDEGNLTSLKEGIEAYLSTGRNVDGLLRQRFEAIRDELHLVMEPLNDEGASELRKLYNEGTELKSRRHQHALDLYEKYTAETETEISEEVGRLEKAHPDRLIVWGDIKDFWDKRASVLHEQSLDFVEGETETQEEFMAGVMAKKREFEAKRDQAIKDTYHEHELLLANFECSRKFYEELSRICEMFTEWAVTNGGNDIGTVRTLPKELQEPHA